MGRAAMFAFAIVVLAVFASSGEHYTRGVVVYAGNPAEDIAPVLVPDTSNYRTMAPISS